MTSEERLAYNSVMMVGLEEGEKRDKMASTEKDPFKGILFQHWSSTRGNPYHSVVCMAIRSPSFKEGKMKTFAGKGKESSRKYICCTSSEQHACFFTLPTVVTLFETWLRSGDNESRVQHFLTLSFQRAVFKGFLPQKNLTLLSKVYRCV